MCVRMAACAESAREALTKDKVMTEAATLNRTKAPPMFWMTVRWRLLAAFLSRVKECFGMVTYTPTVKIINTVLFLGNLDRGLCFRHDDTGPRAQEANHGVRVRRGKDAIDLKGLQVRAF